MAGTFVELIAMSLMMFAGSLISGYVPIYLWARGGKSAPVGPNGAGTTARSNASFWSGMAPIVNSCGAGIFVGTSLAVIIPEATTLLLKQACQQGIPHSFGISISLGFALMLLIDHVPNLLTGGSEAGHSHGHRPKHRDKDDELTDLIAIVDNTPSPISSSVFIGILVHSAADGIALGAVCLSKQSAVEFIVFLALMIHKAPASFSIMSHLTTSAAYSRAALFRSLVILSLSAPLCAIFTYLLFAGNAAHLTDERLGLLLLFSAGTFLYVAVVHVLPEVIMSVDHISWRILLAIIVGLMLPSVFDMSHGHHQPGTFHEGDHAPKEGSGIDHTVQFDVPGLR